MKATRAHLVTAALTAAAASMALAAGSSAAPARSGKSTSLNLTNVQASFVAVPAISKKSPPQVGGRMIFENVLYNRTPQFGKPAGARVGTAETLCTILSMHSLECVVTAHLPGGELVLAGSNPTRSHHTTFAVVGGSGIFSNASGSSTSTDLSPTKSVVTGTLNL